MSAPMIAAVATLTVFAAILRFYRLGHQGFWFDEANTVLLVHLSPGKMLGLIPQSESTPPLYYCLAWVWARIFGFGEVGLRSLSAVAGVLVVPVAYGAGARLMSVRAGLIAAALAAFNPLLIWYSQEARSYELLVLLSGLSLLTFAVLLERPAPRAAAAWVIASALALATHYYAVLLVIPEAVWLLVVHRRRRPAQVGVGLVALCGLALIPLALSQNGTGNSSWIHHAALTRRLKEIVPQFVIGFGSPAYGILEPLAVALAVLGLLLLAFRSERFERRGAMLAGGLALSGLILNLVLVAGGIDDLLTRNVLALWMPAALLVTGGFAASRARLLGALAAAALCGVGIVAAVGVARDRNLQRPGLASGGPAAGPASRLRPAARFWSSTTGTSCPSRSTCQISNSCGAAAARVSEVDVISFTSPRSAGFCWWGSACNLWPSRMQADYAIPGFTAVSRATANQFTVLRMRAQGTPALVSPRAVARSLRTTNFRNDELLIQR